MQNAECRMQNENRRLNGSHSPFCILPSSFFLLHSPLGRGGTVLTPFPRCQQFWAGHPPDQGPIPSGIGPEVCPTFRPEQLRSKNDEG